MKKIFLILIIFLSSCSSQEITIENDFLQEENISKINNISQEKIILEDKEVVIEEHKDLVLEDKEIETEYSTWRETPEIPSEAEMQELPDCDGLTFTDYPVDMKEIYEITPIGNLAPPGHTFPTDHSYLHIHAGGESSESIELYAPADVYIENVYSMTGATTDPIDYTIYFSLCKDIIGYYNHVKELSPQLEAMLKDVNCEDFGQQESTACSKNLLEKVDAGTLIGKVGGLQGNFDFGLIDLRKELDYVNINRYPTRSRYVQCVYDYYPKEMQETFFSLIKRNSSDKCGIIQQDVEGTLQGNWFNEDASQEYVVDWTQYLAFVHDNSYPDISVISIGGIVTDATKFEFSAQDSGTKNMNFADVTVDGNIYCYEDEDPLSHGQDDGKILVKMESATNIQIEWQSGSCSSTEAFKNSEHYER